MNFDDHEIEVLLFSINVLNRFAIDLIPKNKIEEITKHINQAEIILKNKISKCTANSISAMHLACETVKMINDNEFSVDIFTKNKCNNYYDDVIILSNKLQNYINYFNKLS